MTHTTTYYHNEQPLTVTYNVRGKYRPATMEEPAEWPEVEILSIWDAYGSDVFLDENEQYLIGIHCLEQTP